MIRKSGQHTDTPAQLGTHDIILVFTIHTLKTPFSQFAIQNSFQSIQAQTAAAPSGSVCAVKLVNDVSLYVMLVKLNTYYGWIKLSIFQNLVFFNNKKKPKTKQNQNIQIKTFLSTRPCSSLIIKALSGVNFIHTQAHSRKHTLLL